jgi:hypothetical protein
MGVNIRVYSSRFGWMDGTVYRVPSRSPKLMIPIPSYMGMAFPSVEEIAPVRLVFFFLEDKTVVLMSVPPSGFFCIHRSCLLIHAWLHSVSLELMFYFLGCLSFSRAKNGWNCRCWKWARTWRGWAIASWRHPIFSWPTRTFSRSFRYIKSR